MGVHGGNGKLDQVRGEGPWWWWQWDINQQNVSSLLLGHSSGSFLSPSGICYPLIGLICLMMEERDGPGRRGWFPLSMHVHIFRAKVPPPGRGGAPSGPNIKVAIGDGRIPA